MESEDRQSAFDRRNEKMRSCCVSLDICFMGRSYWNLQSKEAAKPKDPDTCDAACI